MITNQENSFVKVENLKIQDALQYLIKVISLLLRFLKNLSRLRPQKIT